MKKTRLLLLLLIAAYNAVAQYNIPANNIWAMGKNAGISFTGSNPAVINTNFEISYSISYEGGASISDGSGLIFYTNGTTIWNSQGQVMPNGARINGNNYNSASSSQGALIVPVPRAGEPRFYLFTMNSHETGKLFCNLVDCSLNGGLGDIDTSFYLHKVAIGNDLAEKLIAIPGCNGNIWVLVHKQTSNVFHAYNVTASGIDLNPVVSVTGNAINYAIGVMKVRPSYDKIAACCGNRFQLFDFDNTTGMVSNAYLLDSVPQFGYYGCAFSSDGSKLYAKEFVLTGNGLSAPINQFNVNAPNPMATKINIGFASPNLSDLQLAPDGRIYFASAVDYTLAGNSPYAGRISSPNNSGAACSFRDSITTLYFPGSFAGGLPNTVIQPLNPPPSASGSVTDTAFCIFPGSGITLHAAAGYTSYQWDNGTHNSSRLIHQPGVYWVRYKIGTCGYLTDTFRVRVNSIPPAVIANNNGTLYTIQAYTTYQWYKEGQPLNGATSQYCATSGIGWYSVRVTDTMGCKDSTAYEFTGNTAVNDPAALKTSIRIYPNPASNTVSVEAPVPVHLSLFSTAGKRLLTQQEQSTMDISKIAGGLYFIYITDKNNTIIKVEKLVIRHTEE